MTFAKKTLSCFLATVMLATSLFVGTTAFAAGKTFTPIATSVQASAKVNDVVDVDHHVYTVDGESFFSYTPLQTGTFAISFASTPIYKTYDASLGENVYSTTATAGAERVDNSQLAIYEKYDALDDNFSDMKLSLESTGSYDSDFVQVGGDINPVKTYYKGYATVELQAGKTYYVTASSDYYFNNVQAPAIQDERQYVVSKDTITIMPTDWTYNLGINVVSEKTFDVAGVTETRSIKAPFVQTTYVGSAKDVVVPQTINGIAVEELEGSKNMAITSLTLSSTVKNIAGFDNMKMLAAVTLNSGLEYIDVDCFYADSALQSISIPATVKKIGSSAFMNCTALNTVALAEGLQSVGSYAFYNTALTKVFIPYSVRNIDFYAFGYVENFNTNTVAPYDTIETPVADFIVSGYNGTEGALYAATYGFQFCDYTYGCAHILTTVSTAPTLFAKGSNVSTCKVCGAVLSQEIAKKKFKISSLKSTKKGKITVKASKQSGIKGYKIQYSTSKKFTKKTTKTVTVNTKKALNKTITGLKSKKTYYVRVRAYKVSGGKNIYSSYTATKSVKVK